MANRGGTAMAPQRSQHGLTTHDPFRLFQERLNRFFGETYPSPEENWSVTTWAPAVDIYETENEIVVKAELPEVKKENVKVTLEDSILTIRGERNLESETKRENYHRVERRYGEFVRSFTLPAIIDPATIKAEFQEGMLRVTMSKREEAKPKQVEVTVR